MLKENDLRGLVLTDRVLGIQRMSIAFFVLLMSSLVAVSVQADGVEVLRGGSEGRRFELLPMTYVSGHEGRNDLVLDAALAHYDPATNRIYLEDVKAKMLAKDGGAGFELTSKEGNIDLQESWFVAEGLVRGLTTDGRRLETERMKYTNTSGVVSTDLPVLIRERDSGMVYRGNGGFEYNVQEGRFKLLGGATVVQKP